MVTEQDIRFMREALRLAESMRGRTSPDPMVGAVIVKEGEIISRGYHAEVTTPHAEVFVLEKAGKKAKGATMYVNLEPCCHFGNNPPCTTPIIESGIKKVVAAMQDPNPLVSGKGFGELKEGGVEVEVGVLEEEAKRLNEMFIKYITTERPFVILKSAMSLDGKIATKTGESFWITGMGARRYVHRLRSQVDAVMVGMGTIIKDDPELTVRDVGLPGQGEVPPEFKPKNPQRIILDGRARIPLTAKVIKKDPSQTIIVTGKNAPADKVKHLKNAGVEVLTLEDIDGLVDLDKLMVELGKKKITSLLIEGGGRVNAGAIKSGIVDKVIFFLSPKIIGGQKAPTPVEGEGIELLSQAINIRDVRVKKVDGDILIEGYVVK